MSLLGIDLGTTGCKAGVFSLDGRCLGAAYREYEQALRGHAALVCYSVKANSNLAVLALLARLGAGFDIVSGGELARVLAAGGDPAKVLFSGVGKSEAEIEQAIISAMHDSFFAERDVTTADILAGLRETVPLSTTTRERIADLRAWARTRARPVSSAQPKPNATPGNG